ncbi:MAG: hypothetical protein Q8928_10320 [Bacteroidota bacterium]|nr:hypothetical protein [Bacteroidota bacterium]
MKIIICFSIGLLLVSNVRAQDENILIGLNSPAYGVRIKANWPSNDGGWARGFYLVNQDNTQNFFGFGAFGICSKGIPTLGYGWIGTDYNNTFMTFMPTGQIGIGTTSPAYKLDVIGSFRVTGNSELLGWSSKIYGNYDPNNYYLGHYAVSGSDGLDIHWYGGIRLGDYTGNVMQISNGQIGIGTSTPAYKLDVIGTIRAREIKVDLNGADFVFEKNYKLMPLTELEQFVKEQKHLPEVASAKEMEKNGTDLGNLNTKLLQKIEELTLYTIDQQKQIDELKKQNAKIEQQQQELQALKKEIEKLKPVSK